LQLISSRYAFPFTKSVKII